MKKYIIVSLLVCLYVLISEINVLPAKTGHAEISEVTFIDSGKLLIDMTDKEINDAYKKVSLRKMFGWSLFSMNLNRQVIYIGETIFSRSNLTTEDISIKYTVTETNYSERSVTVSNSISTKFKGKLKKALDMEVNASFDIKTTTKNTNQLVEKTDFEYNIKRNRMVTLRIVGRAYVSNGVSKDHVFWITSSKGTWEYIDIVSRTYELIEVSIK